MNRRYWYSRPAALWLSCVALLWLVGCALSPPQPTPTPVPLTGPTRPVVIDTDMGADDIMALLYLLQRPDVEVKAITVSGTGLARCAAGVQNARGLTSFVGQPRIPVACGRDAPLQDNYAFPRDWRDRADAAYGLTLPSVDEQETVSAEALLRATLEASPEEITIVALGPLTNLAQLLLAPEPPVEHIEQLIIMGGALDVPGNVGASGVGIANEGAEWNVYVDAVAADAVLQSRIPMTLVPLDATNHAPVTPAFLDTLRERRESAVANTVYELLNSNRDLVTSGGYYFWDPLAAALLTDPDLATYEQRQLQVLTDGGPQHGSLQVTSDGEPLRVAVSADGPRFEALFLQVLNRP